MIWEEKLKTNVSRHLLKIPTALVRRLLAWSTNLRLCVCVRQCELMSNTHETSYGVRNRRKSGSVDPDSTGLDT